MQLARFLNKVFKKDGFILEDANLKNYIIVKVNEKRVTDAKETAKLLDQLGKRGFRIAVEMINIKGEKELYTYR